MCIECASSKRMIIFHGRRTVRKEETVSQYSLLVWRLSAETETPRICATSSPCSSTQRFASDPVYIMSMRRQISWNRL